MAEWILRGRRVLLPNGLQPAAIHVRDERIAQVGPADSFAGDITSVDVGDLVLLPGLVDSHVHINEPGRTEWEGFVTATRAAAAGGITTLVDMPLNSSPVTIDPASLQAKVAASAGKLHVDVAFHGGLVPASATGMSELADAGVSGFKAFLVHSGIDDFPAAGEIELRAAMPAIAKSGLVLLAHAELFSPLPPPKNPKSYADYLASRPSSWETAAIELLCRLSEEYDCPVHIVHVATGDAIPIIHAARDRGIKITAETCPHYLYFAAEEVPDGATQYKCAPPIREAAHRERLWQALVDGDLDLIASDHSPCPPALKKLEVGDYFAAWGGISSLQLGFSIVWTGMRERGIPLEKLDDWMAGAPARLVRLDDRKGKIAVGYDADFVAFDPDASFIVDPLALYHRHAVTPYGGRLLHGVVRRTWLRGKLIYANGAFPAGPAGKSILRRFSE